MHAYYEARAREYEEIYAKPERQADLARLKAWLAEEARDRAILEIACGTGYWTAIAATTAYLILAIDRSIASLELARSKALGPRVDFAEADAYGLPNFARASTAAWRTASGRTYPRRAWPPSSPTSPRDCVPAPSCC